MEHSPCHIYSKHFNPNWVTPLPPIVLKEIKRKHLLSRERRRGLCLWTVQTTEMLHFHTTEGPFLPQCLFLSPYAQKNPSTANGLTANQEYCLHPIFIYSKSHLFIVCTHMCACVCMCGDNHMPQCLHGGQKTTWRNQFFHCLGPRHWI